VTAALIDDLAQTLRDLRSTQVQVDAVRTLPDRPDEVVAVASSGDVDPRAGRTITAGALALLVVLLILLFGYLKAIVDKRIRSDDDVHLALGSDDLPVLATTRSANPSRLAAVTGGVARAHGTDTVHLLGVDDAADAASLARSIRGAMEDARPVSVVAHTLESATLPTDGAVLLVAARDRSTSDALVRASRELRFAGVSPAGLLITD
jgi:hypothetical protein